MAVSLLLALLVAQPTEESVDEFLRPQRVDRVRRAGGRSGPALAFFEFAPSSGAGMGAPCACTAPTGAKGEALTFTRTGAATCTKTTTGGLATTGIADGDLVVCASNNQPRVEYDSNGVLGLLVESARTNSTIRSQEFENGAWILNSVGVALPTRTANYATAPDGTLTAERLQFTATGVGQESVIYQTAACPVSTDSASVYVKGTSGSGSIDFVVNRGGGNFSCSTCSFVAESWTRCRVEGSVVASSGNLIIGNEGSLAACGTGARSAADVLVWGAQCEAGAYATSYIPTTSAAVARNAETADFAITLAPPGGVSIASTVEVPSTQAMVAGSGLWLPGLSAGAVGATFASPYVWPYAGSTGGNLSIDSTGSATVAAATAVAGATTGRYRASFNAAWTVCRDASCATGAASVWSSPTFTRVKLNAVPGVTAGAHLFSRICVDPDATRCR